MRYSRENLIVAKCMILVAAISLVYRARKGSNRIGEDASSFRFLSSPEGDLRSSRSMGKRKLTWKNVVKSVTTPSLSPAGLAAGQEIDLPARADLSSPGKINFPLSLSYRPRARTFSRNLLVHPRVDMPFA